MVLEGYMDPSHQMAPSRVGGGMAHSSSSSGIFFQGDGQSQVGGNSHLTTSFGNSSSSVPGIARRNLGLVPTDVSNNVLNSVASSAPSMGASSLVTDANSGLSGGPQLQRSASINTESYMRVPASPLSFSSNNISISGSSVMDGSSVVQQSSNRDPTSQQVQQNQHHQGNSSATSRLGQVQLPFNGLRVPGTFLQDPGDMSRLQKKPCLDFKQEDVVQQQLLQQMLQRQDPMRLQNPNPQLQALIHQQRLRQQHAQQQQQMLQSMPPMQRAQLLQQQQQHQELQLRQQLQQQGAQSVSGMKRPHDGGVCSRRLMQYLYHQRQRPSDNNIAYWRKFVAEYFSPHAKKRWCLSLYDNVGHHSLGVFPQASVDAWQCDICCSKSGRGFEATFEVLPRLNEIKFGSGVIEDFLYLGLPRESRSPTGMMFLEFDQASQHSVYEQVRVIRTGQLRIIFTPDLKMLTWEFCARRHEEMLTRKMTAPQVNHLLQVSQKWQSSLSESSPDGVSQPDLQANSNMAFTAGRQLARSLDSQPLNDLGFSKRYVRCLQVAEVVNNMKDLMDFVREQKVGPIEGLKSYTRHATSAKIQMQKVQEMEVMGGSQGLSTDRNTLNKLMALHPGLHCQISNNQQLGDQAGSSGSAQAASVALTNYQKLVTRQNSMNPNAKSALQETFQGGSPGMQNLPVGNFSNTFILQQGQSQQPSENGLVQKSHHQTLQGSQALQQQMIQQMLQDIKSDNNNEGGVQQQPSLSGQSAAGSVGFDNGTPVATVGAGNISGPTPSRSNSFNASSNIESSAGGGGGGGGGANNTGSSQKAPILHSNLHLTDEVVPDIPEDFTDGFFDNDLDDMDDFGWQG